MREVARHAGLDNATLHYYFEGKEALIYGVLDYIAPDLSITYFQPKPARAISARKLLSTHFRNLQRHRTEHPEVFIVLSEIETRSIRDPAIRTFIERIDEGRRTVLMSILETGIKTGEFRSDLDVNRDRDRNLMIEWRIAERVTKEVPMPYHPARSSASSESPKTSSRISHLW
jgi:AcrR family transcriptional regulator